MLCVSCLVLSDSLWPHDYSLPGSSIHGILQARILEWVVILFSRRSSWPRERSQIFCSAGRFFTAWDTKEALFEKVAYWSEKAMAPHSSTLAWKIPWTEEPGGLQSMRSLGVDHDWASSLSLFTFMHWRRKWQPTPVFLPGESQGQRSLGGCCLWGLTESDTTEVT